MNNLNLLILAIYIICVAYVISQALKSLDDRLIVQVNESLLKQELESRQVQNLVAIKFNFEKRYKLNDLKQLAIIIENKSDQHSLYVEWDYCSITDLGGRSRRAIRLPPGMMMDLSQPQVFSPVAPKQTLREKLTAEDGLKRKTEPGVLDLEGILVNIAGLEKGSPGDKKRYADFIHLITPLSFSVRLALRWSEYALLGKGQDVREGIERVSSDYRVYINCLIEINKVPWTDALPWNQAKKSTQSKGPAF
jgi:hypothetical protein